MEVFTIDEVAEKLQVTDRTVYKLIKEGKLVSKRLGRYHRITDEDLNKFIRELPNSNEEE